MLGNRNGLIFVYVCVPGHMSVSVCVCLHLWYVCLEYAQSSVCLWRPKVNSKCLPQCFCFCFWDGVSPELVTFLLDWLPVRPRISSVPLCGGYRHMPHATPYLAFTNGSRGSKLGSFCLCNKPLPPEPAPQSQICGFFKQTWIHRVRCLESIPSVKIKLFHVS